MTRQINPRMIELALQARGFTQTEFAKIINTAQSTLSKITRGEAIVTVELLDKISQVLKFKKSFFYRQNTILPVDTYYRKTRVIDAKTKLKAEATINILKFCIDDMLKSIELPTTNIFTLTNQQYLIPNRVRTFM